MRQVGVENVLVHSNPPFILETHTKGSGKECNERFNPTLDPCLGVDLNPQQ